MNPIYEINKMTNTCKCTEELKIKQNDNKSKIH